MDITELRSRAMRTAPATTEAGITKSTRIVNIAVAATRTTVAIRAVPRTVATTVMVDMVRRRKAAATMATFIKAALYFRAIRWLTQLAIPPVDSVDSS